MAIKLRLTVNIVYDAAGTEVRDLISNANTAIFNEMLDGGFTCGTGATVESWESHAEAASGSDATATSTTQRMWVLHYPHESGSRCVGPFPTKQAALDHPIESDVCSITPLVTPEYDLENDQ